MASSTLYTFPDNFRDYKTLIAAQYSKANLKVEPDFVFGKTNKSSEFLKKFPHGKVPALQTANNKFIFESNAIAYYVSNEQLRGGSCAVDQAQVIQWMSFADQEIIPHMANWVFPCLNIMLQNKQATDTAKESLKRTLGTLDAILLNQTFLVGERVTLADICVASALVLLYRNVLEPSYRASFGNVNRWFLTCVNQPEFKAVLKDVTLCDKAVQFDAKKYAELQGSGAGSKGKAEKKVKEAKPQQKTPKKEEVPEPAEEMDETELILAKEDKPKDPFEAYPKGTFVMDNFKKSYSNEDTNVSIPFFWNNFDKENFSIWHCEYKYPEDLTMVFMSCNLISGMMQRLDKMRKNAFGSMLLFGEDNKSTISGIWVWRGHDLAFTLSSDWQVDYESYSWRKLDPGSEETKKLVQEYFSWEGDFGGKKFNQGKIFK